MQCGRGVVVVWMVWKQHSSGEDKNQAHRNMKALCGVVAIFSIVLWSGKKIPQCCHMLLLHCMNQASMFSKFLILAVAAAASHHCCITDIYVFIVAQL